MIIKNNLEINSTNKCIIMMIIIYVDDIPTRIICFYKESTYKTNYSKSTLNDELIQ